MRSLSLHVAALLLALAACSSPSGSDPGTQKPPPAAAVPDEVRLITLGEIEARLEELVASQPDTYREAFAAYLNDRAEFAWADLQPDGSLVAFFVDGRALIVPVEREAEAAEVEASELLMTASRPEPTPPPDVASTARARLAVSATSGVLPASPRARVIESMGTAHASAAGFVEQALEHAGYQVQASSGSLADLDLRSAGMLGTLYVSSHGSPFVAAVGAEIPEIETSGFKDRPGPLAPPPAPTPDEELAPDDFVLSTSESVTTATEEARRQDLDAGRLVYVLTTFDAGAPKTHVYGITTSWIKTYWTGAFSANAFVFVDACHGSHPILLAALRDAGASLAAGWNGVSTDERSVLRATPYFFDRATGRNHVEPASPPNRPAEIHPNGPVLFAMRERGYHLDPHTGAVFDVYPLASNISRFALRPQLSRFGEATGGYLDLYGTLGALGGTLTVGGVEVALVEPDHYGAHRFELPLSGVGSFGEVVYTDAGRTTNPLWVTSWRMDVELQRRGPGSLRVDGTCSLHYRGGRGETRVAVDSEETLVTAAGGKLEDDSVCTYSATGSYTHPGGGVETWSGGGTVHAGDMRTEFDKTLLGYFSTLDGNVTFDFYAPFDVVSPLQGGTGEDVVGKFQWYAPLEGADGLTLGAGSTATDLKTVTWTEAVPQGAPPVNVPQ